jgi:hypothetical protein
MNQSGGAVEQIGNLIRYWVHYDNSISALNKQVKTARDLKTNYEKQILEKLKEANMKDPLIQIGGGRLIVSEHKQTAALTFTNLESLLTE